MQTAAAIQRQIGALYKKRRTDEYDDEEVLRAILHAEQVHRACIKKKKHLETEEAAEQKEDEEELPADEEERVGDADSDEEIRRLSQEEFEALMEKLELSEEEMLDKAEETAELDTELDEMAEALSGVMEPEDLKQMKARHRSEEERDILRADLKYLRALFERLQSEKENIGKGLSGSIGGVTLSIGGMEQPVMVSDLASADTGCGMMIDTGA